MINKVMVIQFECNRCHKRWFPRTDLTNPVLPSVCSFCKSPKWNEGERQRANEIVEKPKIKENELLQVSNFRRLGSGSANVESVETEEELLEPKREIVDIDGA